MGHKNDSMVVSIAPLSSIDIKIRPLAKQLGQVNGYLRVILMLMSVKHDYVNIMRSNS